MLKRLKAQGITILVSTPYMDEATMCERIALIQAGKIMSVNTPSKIMAAYGKNLYAIRSANMGRLLRDLRTSTLVESCNAFGEFHHITFNGDAGQKNQETLLLQLQQSGLHSDLEMKLTKPGIEDCFIKLMR
jgi:ABC-type multidrug transport system ATPase subunit